ncbi:MAG: hypothetical protein WD183_01330, partial [Nitrosopumilaceae archaeon]
MQMIYQCSFCDIESDSLQDEKFQTCMENNHEILKYLPPNEEKDALKPRKYSKKSAITKVKGFVCQYYVESIVIDGRPKFLAKLLDSNDIIIKDSIEIDDKAVQPLNFNECGYTPYSFTSSEIMEMIDQPISTESLIEELKSVIDRYIVAKELDKYLIVGNILVTYGQEQISTVHFPYFVGETESGKSSVLHLGKWLNYRCLYGEDIPNADIY